MTFSLPFPVTAKRPDAGVTGHSREAAWPRPRLSTVVTMRCAKPSVCRYVMTAFEPSRSLSAAVIASLAFAGGVDAASIGYLTAGSEGAAATGGGAGGVTEAEGTSPEG